MEAVIDDYIEPAELTVGEHIFLHLLDTKKGRAEFGKGFYVMSTKHDQVRDVLFLQLHTARYQEEVTTGKVGYNTAFDYGWCLIRSRKTDEVMKGIEMFKRENLHGLL